MNYWFLYKTADGSIYGSPYLGYADEWTNIPSGCAVLGPIADTDATAQDAYANPMNYSVQSGALVKTATSAQLLQQAKNARLAYLAGAFAQAIGKGFPSSADGTSRTYAIDPVAMGKWSGTMVNINSGLLTANIQVKDISGNKVSLTPAQFKQMAMDGFTYFNNQEQNLWTKEDDVNAATTVTDVNAVVY